MKRGLLLILLVLGVSAVLMAGGEAEGEDHKLAVVAVKHPYFAPMETAANDYEENTGIETEYRATQNFDMEEENVIIEGVL
jgi:ABC-type sugar transport system substrate-binding protein